MRTYRIAWTLTAAVLTTACVVHDAMSGGWQRLAVLGPVMAVFGGILGFVFADDGPRRWTWARRGLVWTGLGAMAADGLVVAWEGAGVLVGVVLLLTAPVAVRQVRELLLARSSRRTTGPPETLATRDLHRRWDWTTREVLRASTSVARRLVLAEERRMLLDELQRRDPAHFDAWTATAVPDRPSERSRGRDDGPWGRGW